MDWAAASAAPYNDGYSVEANGLAARHCLAPAEWTREQVHAVPSFAAVL